MMTRDGGKNRDQIEFTSLDELVPEDHLVRKLENAIDWRFIACFCHLGSSSQLSPYNYAIVRSSCPRHL